MTNGIQFDEDRGNYAHQFQQQQQGSSSGMAAWLIRHGLAKSQASAQVTMIILAIVNLAICFMVIKYFL